MIQILIQLFFIGFVAYYFISRMYKREIKKGQDLKNQRDKFYQNIEKIADSLQKK